MRKIIKEFFTVPVDCPASTATQMRKMYKVVITNSSTTDTTIITTTTAITTTTTATTTTTEKRKCNYILTSIGNEFNVLLLRLRLRLLLLPCKESPYHFPREIPWGSASKVLRRLRLLLLLTSTLLLLPL